MQPASASLGMPSGIRSLIAVAALFIVLAGVKSASTFLIPVSLAVFLAVLSLPMMVGFQRIKIPHAFALLLTVLINLAVLTGLFYAATSLLVTFWENDLQLYLSRIREQLGALGVWLEEKGFEGASDRVGHALELSELQRYVGQTDIRSATSSLLGPTLAVFGAFTAFLAILFVIFVTMAFVLSEASNMEMRLEAVRRAGGPDLRGLIRAGGDIQKYIAIKTAMSLLTGLLAALLCAAFGIKYALLWGILAAVLNYIPAIGSTVAGIPPIFIAFSGGATGGPIAGVFILIAYVTINNVISNLLEPIFLGRRFGVSTLVIFLSVIFWGWMWGPAGMFLAVPLTMLVKVALDSSADFRWLGVAMGKRRTKKEGLVLEESEDDVSGAYAIGAGAATETPSRQ